MKVKDKLINWAFGNAIAAQAAKLVKQVSSKGVDPDDDKWRGLLKSRRDLMPIDQDRMIEIANYLVRQNLLGARISSCRRDFVIGDGIKYEADAPEIQKLLDAFWKDPVNNFDEFQFEITEYLGINGETFLPAYKNKYSGQVQLGWIDPFEVQDVIADTQNRRVMRKVILKDGAGAGTSSQDAFAQKKEYQVINVEQDPDSPEVNYRTGEIFHFRTNCAPDGTRGRSDFEAAADQIDAYDQSTWSDIERKDLVGRFIWDVLLKGFNKAQIDEWLREQAEPGNGSIRAHNEEVEWDAVTPDLKLTDSRVHTDGIRKDALGGMGLSDTFFGRTEDANKASAEAMDMPILKSLQSRQRKIRAIFCELADYVIDQKALADSTFKGQLESGQIKRAFKVITPEISSKDVSRVGAVVAQFVTAIEVLMDRKLITPETAAKIVATFLQQFSIEYDAQKEFAAAQNLQSNGIPPEYDAGKVADFNSRLTAASRR
jgi:hypothetical protein